MKFFSFIKAAMCFWLFSLQAVEASLSKFFGFKEAGSDAAAQMSNSVIQMRDSINANVPQLKAAIDGMSSALRNVGVTVSIGPETSQLINREVENILKEASKARESYDLSVVQFQRIVDLMYDIQVMADKNFAKGLGEISAWRQLLKNFLETCEAYALTVLAVIFFGIVYSAKSRDFEQLIGNLFDTSLIFCALVICACVGLYVSNSIELLLNHGVLMSICFVVCVAPMILHIMFIDFPAANPNAAQYVMMANDNNNARLPHRHQRRAFLWKAYSLVLCFVAVFVLMPSLRHRVDELRDVPTHNEKLMWMQNVLSRHVGEMAAPGRQTELACTNHTAPASHFGEVQRFIFTETKDHVTNFPTRSFILKAGKYFVHMRGHLTTGGRMFARMFLEILENCVDTNGIAYQCPHNWKEVLPKPIQWDNSNDHYFGNSHLSDPGTLTDLAFIEVKTINTYRINIYKRNGDANAVSTLEVFTTRVD